MWPIQNKKSKKIAVPFQRMGDELSYAKSILDEMNSSEEQGWTLEDILNDESIEVEDVREDISTPAKNEVLTDITNFTVTDPYLKGLLERQRESMSLLDVFGITLGESLENDKRNLEQGYKQFSLYFHPDRGGPDTAFFKEIVSAYKLLSEERAAKTENESTSSRQEEDTIKLRADFTKPQLVTKATQIAFFFDENLRLCCKTSQGQFVVDNTVLNEITDENLQDDFRNSLKRFNILQKSLEHGCNETPESAAEFIKKTNIFLLKRLQTIEKTIIVDIAIRRGTLSLDALRSVSPMVKTPELAEDYKKAVHALIKKKQDEKEERELTARRKEEEKKLLPPPSSYALNDIDEDEPLLSAATTHDSLLTAHEELNQTSSSEPASPVSTISFSSSSNNLLSVSPPAPERFEDFFSDENARRIIQQSTNQTLISTLIKRCAECAENINNILTKHEVRDLAVALSQQKSFENLKDITARMLQINKQVLASFLEDPVCCYWGFVPRKTGMMSTKAAKADFATSSYSERKNLFDTAIKAHSFTQIEIENINDQRSKDKASLISTTASKEKVGQIKPEHLDHVFSDIIKVIKSSSVQTPSKAAAASFRNSPNKFVSNPETPLKKSGVTIPTVVEKKENPAERLQRILSELANDTTPRDERLKTVQETLALLEVVDKKSWLQKEETLQQFIVVLRNSSILETERNSIREIYSAVLPQFTENIATLYTTNKSGFDLTMLSYGINWPDLPESRPHVLDENVWIQLQEFTAKENVVSRLQIWNNSYDSLEELKPHAEKISRQVLSVLPNGYDALISSFNACAEGEGSRHNFLKNIAGMVVFDSSLADINLPGIKEQRDDYNKFLSLDSVSFKEQDRLIFSTELLKILGSLSSDRSDATILASKIATAIDEQQRALQLGSLNEHSDMLAALQLDLLSYFSTFKEFRVPDKTLKSLYTPSVSYTAYEQFKGSSLFESWKNAATLCTGTEWPNLPTGCPKIFGDDFLKSTCSANTQTPSSWEMLQFAALSDRGSSVTSKHRKAYLDNNPVLTKGNWFSNSFVAYWYPNIENYDPRKINANQRREVNHEAFLNANPAITKSNFFSNSFVARWYPNWVDTQMKKKVTQEILSPPVEPPSTTQSLLTALDQQGHHDSSSSRPVSTNTQTDAKFVRQLSKDNGLAAQEIGDILGNGRRRGDYQVAEQNDEEDRISLDVN